MALPLIPLIVALSAAGAGVTAANFMLNTYEGQILRRWYDKTGNTESSLKQYYKLSKSNAMTMIGKLRWYVVHKGVNVDNQSEVGKTALQILKDMKLPTSTSAERTPPIAFLMDVVRKITTNDDDLYLYLRGGATDRDKNLKRAKSLLTTSESIVPVEKYLKLGIGLVAVYGAVRYILPLVTPLLKKGK